MFQFLMLPLQLRLLASLYAGPELTRDEQIAARNKSNYARFRVKLGDQLNGLERFGFMPAYPDPRTDEARDRYNAMMFRRLVDR